MLVDAHEDWLADMSTPSLLARLPCSRPLSQPRPASIPLSSQTSFKGSGRKAYGGHPSLFLLHDAHDALVRLSITTPRIVHGYGPHLREDREMLHDGSTPVSVTPPLSVTGLVEELALGAYLR